VLCSVVVMYSNDASPIHISIVIGEHWSVRGWSWVGLLVWNLNLSSYKVSVHKLRTGCHDSRSKLHQRSFLPVCMWSSWILFTYGSKTELDFSFAFSALTDGIRWNKFRQLVPLLTNRDIWLVRRGRLYSSCVWSSMLHRSETWPVRKEMRWHFSELRWEWSDGCVMLR